MAERDPALRNYLRRYHDFACAVQASRLISLVADEALKDFPKGLPEKNRRAVTSLMRDVARALFLLTGQGAPAATSEKKVSRKSISIKSRGRLAGTAMKLFLSQFLSGGDTRRVGDVDFPYRLRAQELVMLFAHLDAFLGDTLKLVLSKNRNALRRSKMMSWEDILTAGSWEAVVDHLVEAAAYEFGWKSTAEKVRSLEREFTLEVRCPAGDLAGIDDAEQLRHLVTHNNCRISHEYIRRTHRTDVVPGDVIPLPEEFLQGTADRLVMLGSDVVKAVAAKLFDVVPSHLTGVPNRPDGRERPTQASNPSS